MGGRKRLCLCSPGCSAMEHGGIFNNESPPQPLVLAQYLKQANPWYLTELLEAVQMFYEV